MPSEYTAPTTSIHERRQDRRRAADLPHDVLHGDPDHIVDQIARLRSGTPGAFWLKIAALPLALLFTLTIRHRVAMAGTGATPRTRLVAVVSLALWSTVAAAGRWIGFS